MYKSVEYLEVLGAPHTQICGGIVRLGHYTIQMWQGHVSYVKPVCLPHILNHASLLIHNTKVHVGCCQSTVWLRLVQNLPNSGLMSHIDYQEIINTNRLNRWLVPGIY